MSAGKKAGFHLYLAPPEASILERFPFRMVTKSVRFGMFGNGPCSDPESSPGQICVLSYLTGESRSSELSLGEESCGDISHLGHCRGEQWKVVGGAGLRLYGQLRRGHGRGMWRLPIQEITFSPPFSAPPRPRGLSCLGPPSSSACSSGSRMRFGV